MLSPLFEFFEVVAEELSADPSRVLIRANLEVRDDDAPLLDELKKEMKAATTDEAIAKAVVALEYHFGSKGSKLPFSYDGNTGRFEAIDLEFLMFIRNMKYIRSIGGRSHDFECSVAVRLSERTQGDIHRVGHPRDQRKSKSDFNGYLRALGFDRPVLLGKEKDGGFDILWLLPLGAIPHRPIVSVQCKNGEFKVDDADHSVGSALRSFSQHSGLQPSVHVPCVLFNDYISAKGLTTKQFNFVPLGLTDLASLNQPVNVSLI